MTDHQHDTDSFLLGIDNHTSASMTNKEEDFIGHTIVIGIKTNGIRGLNHCFDIPAERSIPDLKKKAQTMLIHAHNKWPTAIGTALCPYAIDLPVT